MIDTQLPFQLRLSVVLDSSVGPGCMYQGGWSRTKMGGGWLLSVFLCLVDK